MHYACDKFKHGSRKSEGFNKKKTLLSFINACRLHDILDIKMRCVYRVMLYICEPRSTGSGADDDGESRGHHWEASDMSKWIKVCV